MVPWQMNKTFIGISYLQNCIKLLQFAPVCQVAEALVILQKIGQNGKVAQSVANLGRESKSKRSFLWPYKLLVLGVGSPCFAVGSLLNP